MGDAVIVFLFGISGTFLGMFVLYFCMRVLSMVVERLPKEESK
jgi:uncharacterized membrane protein